jgi:hypothetical protein
VAGLWPAHCCSLLLLLRSAVGGRALRCGRWVCPWRHAPVHRRFAPARGRSPSGEGRAGRLGRENAYLRRVAALLVGRWGPPNSLLAPCAACSYAFSLGRRPVRPSCVRRCAAERLATVAAGTPTTSAAGAPRLPGVGAPVLCKREVAGLRPAHCCSLWLLVRLVVGGRACCLLVSRWAWAAAPFAAVAPRWSGVEDSGTGRREAGASRVGYRRWVRDQSMASTRSRSARLSSVPATAPSRASATRMPVTTSSALPAAMRK